MGCSKCGAHFSRSTPEFTIEVNGDSDMRLAKVQFRRDIKFILNETVLTYSSAQVIALNFPLIKALLTQDAGCLFFLVQNQKALYNASY